MPLPYEYGDWVKMGRHVQLGDGKVFYVQMGAGFPVIMTGAYGGNSWFYSRVVDAFARQYSVYAVDIPGCARSDTPAVPYGPAEYADSLRELMDGLGIERAHLLANHGSAINAVHLAATSPLRVDRLVIEGAPPWNIEEAERFWRERFVGSYLDENELPRPYDQWSGHMYPGVEPAEREEAVQVARRDVEEHGGWWVATMKQLIRYDLHPRLGLVECPTLVLAGEHDWMSKPELGYGSVDRLARGIGDARLVIIPGAGGRPHFEQPDAYVREVLGFLQGTA